MDLSRKFLRKSASELISQCFIGNDIIQKIEMLRDVIHSECELHKNLSLVKSRIKRLEKSFSIGLIKSDEYDARFTSIQKSILDSLNQLNLNEIVCGFEYNEIHGLIYHIYNSKGEFMYRYIGKLNNGLPDKEGIAKYYNGDFYEGSFKKGNRSGKGVLYDKNRKILKEGTWRNNNFIEKNTAKYYKNIPVGADSTKSIDAINSDEFELIKLPNNTGEELYAFPLKGDSMKPTFEEGDTIVCKQLLEKEEILNDRIYVIYHDEKLVLKIVQKDKLSKDSFKLISENFTKHFPYTITANHNTKFFRLKMHLKKYY